MPSAAFILIVAALLAVLAAAALLFYSMAVARRPKPFLKSDPAFDPAANGGVNPLAGWSSEKDWFAASGAERLRIDAEDGTPLSAWYLEAPPAKDGARGEGNLAILVHGYSSRGASMAPFARHYIEAHGFSILMPDLRGHGESGGAYIGFGWHDRRDLVAWIRRAAELPGVERILLHGVSMGAATVILASGEPDIPPLVRYAIEDCGYTSAWEILRWQLRRKYGLPAFPFMHATDIVTRVRAGYSLKDPDALGALRRSGIPFLFVHGTLDDFVPFPMARVLYEACPSKEKDILEVEGAMHSNAFWVAPERYRAAIAKAVDRHFRTRQAS